MYADDLQIYLQTTLDNLESSIASMNEELNAIFRWSLRFGINVNPDKSQAIVVGRPRMLNRFNINTLRPILFNNIPIPYSSSVKNLGLHIDNSLRWNVQVNDVSAKVTRTLRLLYRHKNFLPRETKVLLVQALILPVFDYADVCYLDMNANLLNKLDRLLNNCIRFIFGLRKFDHISHYRAKLKWLPIRERRNSRTLNVLYSILNNVHSPVYLKSKFQYLSFSHSQQPRSLHKLKLATPLYRTGFLSNSFQRQAIRLWNALPLELRESPVYYTFKKKVKNTYLNK